MQYRPLLVSRPIAYSFCRRAPSVFVLAHVPRPIWKRPPVVIIVLKKLSIHSFSYLKSLVSCRDVFTPLSIDVDVVLDQRHILAWWRIILKFYQYSIDQQTKESLLQVDSSESAHQSVTARYRS